MAIVEQWVSGNLAFGIDWQYEEHSTYVTVAPKLYRYDSYNTNNSGGSYNETLAPDPLNGNNPSTWWNTYGNYASSGWRHLNTLPTRTYQRANGSDGQVNITLAWSNTGTWTPNGFTYVSNGSRMWTLTVPKLATWTVSYDPNGGSPTPQSQTKLRDQALTMTLTKPSREDAEFFDWGLFKDGAWVYKNPGDSYISNENAVFKARWRPKAVVTFNANGGSGAPQQQSYLYPEEHMIEGDITPDTDWSLFEIPCTLPSTVPVKQGCVFMGWAASPDAGTAEYQPSAVCDFYAGQRTLYAVWNEAVTVLEPGEGPYTIGGIVNFTVTKHDQSYTDTVTYRVGSIDNGQIYGPTGSLADFSWDTSTVAWREGHEWPRASTSSQIVNVIVEVETSYNGASLGKSSVTVPMSIPNNDSTKPLLDARDVSAVDANNGYAGTYGAFIQGISQLRVEAEYDMEQKLGAQAKRANIIIIKQSNIVVASKTVDLPQPGVDEGKVSVDFGTNIIANNVGQLRVAVALTDTRGFVSTFVTKDITIAAYSKPTMSGLTAAYYADDIEGPSHLSYGYEFSYSFSESSENKNALLETVKYKAYNSQDAMTTISSENIGASSSSGTRVKKFDSSKLPPNGHYIVYVEIKDSFGNSYSLWAELVTSNYEPIIDLYKSSGVALGSVASTEGLMLGPPDNPWDLHIGGTTITEESGGNGSSSRDLRDNLLYRPSGSRTVGFMELPLPIASGGTGASTASEAAQNLGMKPMIYVGQATSNSVSVAADNVGQFSVTLQAPDGFGLAMIGDIRSNTAVVPAYCGNDMSNVWGQTSYTVDCWYSNRRGPAVTCTFTLTYFAVRNGFMTTSGEPPGGDYEGPYTVTPLAFEGTVLETAGKHMLDDVSVVAIPYSSTANESGGNTVFIAETED